MNGVDQICINYDLLSAVTAGASALLELVEKNLRHAELPRADTSFWSKHAAQDTEHAKYLLRVYGDPSYYFPLGRGLVPRHRALVKI